MKFLGYGVTHTKTGRSEGSWPMTFEEADAICLSLGRDDYLMVPLHGGEPFKVEPPDDVDGEDLV